MDEPFSFKCFPNKNSNKNEEKRERRGKERGREGVRTVGVGHPTARAPPTSRVDRVGHGGSTPCGRPSDQIPVFRAGDAPGPAGSAGLRDGAGRVGCFLLKVTGFCGHFPTVWEQRFNSSGLGKVGIMMNNKENRIVRFMGGFFTLT